MDLQQAIMEFAGLNEKRGGLEVNAPGFCALPRCSSSPYMALCDSHCHQQHSYHYISGPADAICQIAFSKLFSLHTAIHSIHLICDSDVFVESRYLLTLL